MVFSIINFTLYTLIIMSSSFHTRFKLNSIQSKHEKKSLKLTISDIIFYNFESWKFDLDLNQLNLQDRKRKKTITLKISN